MMIKVGSKYEKDKLYTYRSVKFDCDGWADSSKFLPGDYDLCFMKISSSKTIPGWYTGVSWDGLNFKDNMIVTHWKRKEEE